MKNWIWLKWRGASCAINADHLVAFGRARSEGEIWYLLLGDTEDRYCESSLVDFCGQVGVPYKP